MRFSNFRTAVLRVLLVPAFIGTLYLYLYPAVHGCGFPSAHDASPGAQQTSHVAPFRLLALGDPQLEGDTSLPDPDAPTYPSLRNLWARVERGPHETALGFRGDLEALLREDIPRLLKAYRKRLDLWGNDLYLAHIYRAVFSWARPTHTVVLGDLLGSQWIGDGEFGRRSVRFWETVFRGGVKVPYELTEERDRTEVLGGDDRWVRRIMTVTGNHDIGYAGDIDTHRTERFEDAFGNVNWAIKFRLGNTSMSPSQASPDLRLILLNSMNLDGPAWDGVQHEYSRQFIAEQLYGPQSSHSSASATILLTHIPFHKEAGICVDAPFFDYFAPEEGGGIREQNHLSEAISQYILEGLAGDEKRGPALVLNGHDHEGCDTYHSRPVIPPVQELPESANATEESPESANATEETETRGVPWHAEKYYPSAPAANESAKRGLREITVRSMMGSFGGNAGLVSGWYDWSAEEWNFEYSSCSLGVQHVWWTIHVLDLIVIGMGILTALSKLMEIVSGPVVPVDHEKKSKTA